MGKRSNSTNIVENKITSKSNGKITKNKIRKKLKLSDFVKSPENQQRNKISTWLNVSNKKISKSSSSTNDHTKCDSKEESNLIPKRARKKPNKIRKKNKGIKLGIQKEQVDATPKKQKYNTDKTEVRTSPRAHSSKSSLVSKGSGSVKTDIREQIYVTPTKQIYKNEAGLRRSPRGLKSPAPAVSKKLFETYKVLSDKSEPVSNREQINVTPTKQSVKDEAVIRRSPRSIQREFDKKKLIDLPRSSQTDVTKPCKEKRGILSDGNLNVWLKKDSSDKSSSRDLKKQSVPKKRKPNVQKPIHEDRDKKVEQGKRNSEKDNDDKVATKQRKKIDTFRTNRETKTNGKLEIWRNKNTEKSKKESIKRNVFESKSQENIELNSKRQKSKLETPEKKIKCKDDGHEKNNNNAKKHEKSNNRKLKTKIEPTECNKKKVEIKKSKSRKFKEEKENSDSLKRTKKKNNKTLHVFKKQEKLDKYVEKCIRERSQKTKFTHNSSGSSELPSLKKSNKKSIESTESFKKYGVTLPTIAEILEDQNELENYKNQIEAFQEIEFDNFNFSVSELNKTETNSLPILGCKHLTLEEITELFKKNLTYVSDIFFSKTYNDRHDKFFSIKSGNNLLFTRELTHSTSMIVFSFEQKQHMIKLLKDEFDPKDEWTSYFFQVLLPELCLKIFMDVHEMTQPAAVEYLDKRPIDD